MTNDFEEIVKLEARRKNVIEHLKDAHFHDDKKRVGLFLDSYNDICTQLAKHIGFGAHCSRIDPLLWEGYSAAAPASDEHSLFSSYSFVLNSSVTPLSALDSQKIAYAQEAR